MNTTQPHVHGPECALDPAPMHTANNAHAGHDAHAHHNAAASAHAHHGGAANTSLARLATSATVHCLTGCAIGEFAGLTIGVTLGLDPWTTMILATVLGFISGFSLGLRPLVKSGMSVGAAFKTIWLGELLSIATMELVMNFTDYHVGGVQAASIFAPMFWAGFLAALPAGFIAAWPVNYWLLKRNVKKPCH